MKRIKYPSIDVVIPCSDEWRIPYLRRTCLSIESQDYPSNLIKIHISWYYKDKPSSLGNIAEVARRFDAVLVFNKWTDPVFNIGRAYNIAARCGNRDVIALLDSDVIIHPSTFKVARKHLLRNISTIIPVVRTKLRPSSDEIKKIQKNGWNKEWQNIGARRSALGNIIIPRAIFNNIRGYDERMHGWGAIDADICKRVHEYKGCVNLLDYKCPKSIHLDHKDTETKGSDYTKRNRKIYNESVDTVRNPAGWGGILDRQVILAKKKRGK